MNPGPATFTVTGLSDNQCDGEQTYQIVFTLASSDPFFDGLSVPITVTNRDSDYCGQTTVTPQALTIGEGQADTFTITLSSDPGEVVTIDLTPNVADAIVNPPTLTFDGTNFGTPQTVTVTAVDNSIVDGNRAVVIDTVLNATLSYAGANPANVNVLIVDDD